MHVLLLLVMVGVASGQAEVASPKQVGAEDVRSGAKKVLASPQKAPPASKKASPAAPARRVRWVTDPVTRFSEQNRPRRRAVPVKSSWLDVQKVGEGPNAAGWDPWAPPDFNRPYEKKWPQGKGLGYCCQVTVVGLGGGGNGGGGLNPLPGGGGGGAGSPAATAGGSAGAGLSPGIPSAAASNPFSY